MMYCNVGDTLQPRRRCEGADVLQTASLEAMTCLHCVKFLESWLFSILAPAFFHPFYFTLKEDMKI